MTVLQVCAFAAPNAGNFIASLTHLETELAQKGIRTIYAFSDGAADKPWCKEIQTRTKVYFLPTAKARILPATYGAFRRIYRENDVSIVHSHFELYDMPATLMAPKTAKIFWHLHDPIQLGSPGRALLWKIQYGVVGKRARLLSVSDHYRQKVVELGFPECQTTNIPNSIDLKRIKAVSPTRETHVDFLTFGWDFYRKGDDVILQACEKLKQDGYQFKLLLNGNNTTWPVLTAYLNGATPEYLIKGDPVDDVNILLNNSKIFIQASRRETFSYAVCEAAYAGLPVISSDIPGLQWTHALPSVRFFSSENANELYEQMKRMLDGDVPQPEDIAKSREMIETEYSTDAWVQRIRGEYRA